MTISLLRSRFQYLEETGAPSYILFWCPLHSLPRVENILFPFVCFVLLFGPAVPTFSKKRLISSISGSQEGAVGSARRVANTLPLPSPSLFACRQQCVVRGRHQAFSHTLCPTPEPGKCCAAHTDSISGRLSASRVGSLCSTSLPHPGYGSGSVGPACTVSGSLASAPQPISLPHSHHQTRLCNSICPASPQVQGHPLHRQGLRPAPD